MFALLRSSLSAKILAVVLVSTFTALVVSTVALLIYEVNNYRAFLRSDLQTQADILARTIAPALAFDNAEDAGAALALLDRRPSFEAAAIYDSDGAILATYSREDRSRDWPEARRVDEIRVEDASLVLFHPMIESGNRLGTIYLRARYDIGARARAYLLILVSVMGVALIAAGLISVAVMGSVTGPVQSVTRIARRVIEERDFSHRAARTSDDEVGVLVDAFNAMLYEVGARTAELRDANRRKDEFLATLAHELRNPMAPMLNSLSLLRGTSIGTDGAQRGLRILERQLAQLVRLVDDLLDVSRVTSGKLMIRKQIVRLSEIVRSAVETVEPQLDARSQTLGIDLPEHEVYVSADASRLAQVLGNLLNNAIKFSGPGADIALTVEANAEWVRIDVADRGAGISADELDGVFEMFSQGDASGAHGQAGLGVGLALARQLTELHDGTIVAASEGPGRGAVFTVTIPRAEKPAASSAMDEQPDAAGLLRSLRILLVDDNADFASSLALLLGALGHDVRVANDGRQALAIARDFEAEVAILDIGLPDIGGHELAQRLKEAGNGELVLIAISGWGQESDKQRSREAGFDLHLVKPVDYLTIQEALRDLLGEVNA
jgi:signal transduction histidine kinase